MWWPACAFTWSAATACGSLHVHAAVCGARTHYVPRECCGPPDTPFVNCASLLQAYAEVRPRIKGRFAKREEVQAWRVAEAAMAANAPAGFHMAAGNDMTVPVM